MIGLMEEPTGDALADFKRARRRKGTLADPVITDRLPPSSPEAEAGCLGCALLSPNDVMPSLIEKLPTSEVFYDLRFRQVYEVLVSMFDDRVPIDLITVQQELKDLCQLEGVGGLSMLAGLPDLVPSAANWGYYASILCEKHVLRQLISLGTEVSGRAYEHQGEVEQLVDEVDRDIRKIVDGTQNKATLFTAKQLVRQSIDWIEASHKNQGQPSGIPTGFIDFDKLTGGLQNSEMIVIAARPAQGKSSWCFNVAEHVAVNLKIPVGVFSLEMTALGLMNRCMCSNARVNLTSVRDGNISERDFSRLTASAGKINSAPLYIDDAGGTSITQLRAKARRMQQQFGIKLFIVDYLQLITSSRKKAENRQQEVADVSNGLKGISKELCVPVLVACQLNRDIEKDKKRKPRMSDIRESGAIDNDADLIGFLYKPDSESEEQDRDNAGVDRVNLLVAKNRNGSNADLCFTFLKSYTRFETASKIESPECTTPYKDQ